MTEREGERERASERERETDRDRDREHQQGSLPTDIIGEALESRCKQYRPNEIADKPPLAICRAVTTVFPSGVALSRTHNKQVLLTVLPVGYVFFQITIAAPQLYNPSIATTDGSCRRCIEARLRVVGYF